MTLTVAQGAELGNSPPTTSVLYILYLRACKLEQGEGVSGRGDRLRAVQHPDKRSHVTRVRKGERLEDASCLGEGGGGEGTGCL